MHRIPTPYGCCHYDPATKEYYFRGRWYDDFQDAVEAVRQYKLDQADQAE